MLLVVVFNMGVAGVAIGTIVSQLHLLYSGDYAVFTRSEGPATGSVFLKTHESKQLVSEADLSGGHSGRYPEYRHQPVQCSCCSLL